MIINCPQCQTRFKLPESKHDAMMGHSVKCCRCEHVWKLSPQDMADAMPQVEATDDLPPAPLPEPSTPTKRSKKKQFILSFILGLGIALMIVWIFALRSKPEGNSLERDLALSLSPLEIKKDSDETELIVRGHITNETDTLYRLPELNIVLLNKKNKKLSTKKRLPPIRLLGPQRDIPFEYILRNPPEGIYKVEVNFEMNEEE